MRRVVGGELADAGEQHGGRRQSAPPGETVTPTPPGSPRPARDPHRAGRRPSPPRPRRATTCTTSAAVAANTAVSAPAPVPAVRGLDGVEGDQVGARPDRDPAGVGERRATGARRRWPRPAAPPRTSARAPGWRAARRARRPASPRTGRRPRGCRSPASAASRRRAAAATGRSRRRGRARWWGRSTPACVEPPSSVDVARRSGGWRARRWSAPPARRPRRAARSASRRSAARHSSFSATCSDRCTCSGASWRRGPLGDDRHLVARHGAHRVDAAAAHDRRGVSCAATRR